MKEVANRESDLRVLVVAPTGRDSELICQLLAGKGILCVTPPTAEAARVESDIGAGAVILAEEVLTQRDIDEWVSRIARQPSWSDLPVILLTIPGERSRRRMLAQAPLQNLVLLERPVRPETLFSTIQSALRSRRRQYQMRDSLTERAIAEDALRKSEKLLVAGSLAASTAHEINNPLASVTNLLYLIGLSSTLKQSKEYGEAAATELARVSDLVTHTLMFYRESVNPARVQITEVVDSALVMFQSRLKSAGIVVERDFRENSPVYAKAGELRHMVLNLISNAMEAIERDGTLRIRVSNRRELRNGARDGVRLTIADTGSGIHPEIRTRLFDPFVSTKGNTRTGLGLWMSSEIVRRHGGTIQVKSKVPPPYGGTVFSVFLPLHENGDADHIFHDHGAIGHAKLLEIPQVADREAVLFRQPEIVV
jgi:signal transduction histidine kinase